MAILVTLATACCSRPIPQLDTWSESRDAPRRITTFLAQRPIRFVPGSVELRSSAVGTLDSLAAILMAVPKARLAIDGYARSQANAHLNRELSEYRAEAVRLHLALRGVSAERLRAAGHGDAGWGEGVATASVDGRLEPQLVLTLEPG